MFGRFGKRKFIVLGLVCIGLVLSYRTVFAKKRHHHNHQKQLAQPKPQVLFETDVKPILEAHCCRCHGMNRQKADLRLDTLAGVRRGSKSGKIIVPGNAEHSLLITVLSSGEDGEQMPPDGERLTPDQIATLKSWVQSLQREPEANDLHESSADASDHWAFQPPRAIAVPGDDFDQNAIDAFLAVGWKSQGLCPSPSIERSLLLRRVSLDLTGLPPTHEDLQAFIGDSSDRAYERVVDRLLASPQYGERWGRHWMDIWRYSEADGRKAKGDVWWSNVHLWRWRDWIVQSLNRDKGYDRMVVEMLAGDELAAGDPECLVATGFLARNWFKLDRHIWMNNTIEHTSKAFLGMTIACARCHDHKFDPISQHDYYRFRAFFEPHDIKTIELPGAEKDPKAMLAQAYDLNTEAKTWLYIRGDEKCPDKSLPITPGVPARLGGSKISISPIDGVGPQQSSGRRLALARWITDRQNPLAARVAVNHVWARHFGQPLVPNMADFGVRSKLPLHHELLDWLAVEFMNHNWSMKWLHRQIVTSSTYQMQSSRLGANVNNQMIDPDNHYFWRMNDRRMDAEELRDSLLSLAKSLDATEGGPSLDPERGEDSARRSLYYRYSREDKMGFLTRFDAPGVEECYRRQESIVPQQALALENSEFVWCQARRIADYLQRETNKPDRGVFIEIAFEYLLGRSPIASERELCEQFLVAQEVALKKPVGLTSYPLPSPPAEKDLEVAKRVQGLPLILGDACLLAPVSPAQDPDQRAREHLIHALLNHHEFITIR